MTSWETEETKMTEPTYEPIDYDPELIESPPPAAGSIYAEIIGNLIGAGPGAGFLRVRTGGRAPNSVQSGLQAAAKTLGVKVKTRSRKEEEAVYVALRADDEEDEE